MVLGQRTPLSCAGTDLVWHVCWIQVVSSCAGLTPRSLPVFQIHRLVTVKKHRTRTLWFIRQQKVSNCTGQTGSHVRCHEYHSQKVLSLTTGSVIPHTVKRLKVAFWSFSTLRPFLAYCILTPNKFPHSSLEVPRIIQMRETSTSEGGNYYQWILLANS